MNGILSTLATLLLAGLLLAEKKESIPGKLLSKPFLSLLFVGCALIQQRPDPFYYRLIVTGLMFSFLGDVLLIFYRRDIFLAGLVSFLLGHVFFAAAFFSIGGTGSALWWGGCLILVAAGGGIFAWFKPHLDRMMLPTAGYLVVISCMVAGAGRVVLDASQPFPARVVIFTGALFFYLSDFFVARDRFVQKGFGNRLVGLPLYYAAQFMLAFSVGLVAFTAR